MRCVHRSWRTLAQLFISPLGDSLVTCVVYDFIVGALSQLSCPGSLRAPVQDISGFLPLRLVSCSRMFSVVCKSVMMCVSADEFLHNYLFLTIGVVGGTTSDIDQSIVAVGEYEKKEKLQEILTSAGESAPRACVHDTS